MGLAYGMRERFEVGQRVRKIRRRQKIGDEVRNCVFSHSRNLANKPKITI